MRAAELLARWLDQIGPDASVQNNVGFIHQQADISLEHLLELERLLDLTGAAERQAQRRPLSGNVTDVEAVDEEEHRP